MTAHGPVVSGSPPAASIGRKALAGRQRLLEPAGALKDQPGCFSLNPTPGDAIEIETSGGGGSGRAKAPPR